MKHIITLALLLFIIGGTTEVYSQNWVNQLGRRVEQKAKRRVEQNVDRAVNKTFSTAEEAAVNAVKNNNKNGQSAEMAKSDFVTGNKIVFEDDMEKEEPGEFPSHWDLFSGETEITNINGHNAFVLSKSSSCVAPLMDDPHNYLGDVFTVEFDFLHNIAAADQGSFLRLNFHTPEQIAYSDDGVVIMEKTLGSDADEDNRFGWAWLSSGGQAFGEAIVPTAQNIWHHFAVSFNKRTLKVYIDGVRHINVPNVTTPPGWFDISLQNGGGKVFLTNFRIAQGIGSK